MGKVGFEPTTTCVSDRCSTELSYSPKDSLEFLFYDTRPRTESIAERIAQIGFEPMTLGL